MLNECRVFQRIVIDDMEVLYAVKKQIHFSDSTGQLIDLLAVNLKVPPFLALVLEMGNTGNEHACTTAGGIIDRFSAFGLQDLGHQMDHGAVRIELLRSMSAVIGELFDQVFIALAELIFRAVFKRQITGGEMLQQIPQQPVRQTVFIRPGTVAEDANHLFAVCLFDFAERRNDCRTDVFRYLADVIPVMSLGNDELV